MVQVIQLGIIIASINLYEELLYLFENEGCFIVFFFVG